MRPHVTTRRPTPVADTRHTDGPVRFRPHVASNSAVGVAPQPSLDLGQSVSGTGRCRMPLLGRVHVLLLPGFGGRITANVDPPPGESGREPRILTFLTDCQRQLEVRHDDPGRLGPLVDHVDRYNLRGRQSIPDETRRVVRVIDDIDLLATELAHDVAHSSAHVPDASAL